MNQAQDDGATPLFTAAWKGHVEVVRRLLLADADINQIRVRPPLADYC